jgi:hypothetical protein
MSLKYSYFWKNVTNMGCQKRAKKCQALFEWNPSQLFQSFESFYHKTCLSLLELIQLPLPRLGSSDP